MPKTKKVFTFPELTADEDTFPKLVLRSYEKWGDSMVACRKKDYGYWREYTWKDVYHAVKYIALGLASLGFERGATMAIVADNAPEWLWMQLGAQSLGGKVVGLYTDSSPAELKFLFEHSDTTMVVADTQEQVDKVLTLQEELPQVKNVIYWNAKGMWSYDVPWLVGFDKLMALGRDYEKDHPGFFEESVSKGNTNDVCILLYTSGTTGIPKGSLITYHHLFTGARSMEYLRQRKPGDQILSYLPPAWIGEQGSSLTPSLLWGIPVNFVEEPDTVIEDIREIAPQTMFFGPRQWEGYASTIQARMLDSSRLKTLIYNMFMPVGYRISDFKAERTQVRLFWKILGFIAHWALFRPLRDKLGLLKLEWALTGGAAISPENYRLLRAIGLPIRQGFGGTEICGLITIALALDDVLYESSGAPLPGMTVRVMDDSEIFLGGPGLCLGYHKQPEESAKTFAGGYWHTGDAGYMNEDGQLFVYDKVVNMSELKAGGKFAPAYIEGKLKFSPYIRDVMAIGGGDRDYVTCLIDMDYEITGRWAEKNRVVYTSHADLSQKTEVTELIARDVARVNRTLPEIVRVKRFVVQYKAFDPDDEELTRTRKLRRGYMEERYKDLIDALYSDKDAVDMVSNIIYRDGRQAEMRIPVTIKTLE